MLEDPKDLRGPGLEIDESNWREDYNKQEGPVCGHDWNDWHAERETSD